MKDNSVNIAQRLRSVFARACERFPFATAALASGALLLTPTPYFGCGNTPEQVLVVSTFPGDGGSAVPYNLSGNITFNQEYPGDLSRIHAKIVPADESAAEIPLQLSLSEDERAAVFSVSISPDSSYCMHVDVDAQPDLAIPEAHQVACFATSIPCGLTVHVGKDSQITSLGDLGSTGLAFLNEVSDAVDDDLSIVVIMEDQKPGVTWPLTFTALLSGFQPNEDGKMAIPAQGVTSAMNDCTIDANGRGRCFEEEIVIPLSADGHSNTLLVNDCEMTWDRTVWVGDQINYEGFQLTGYATQEAVAATLVSFGEAYEFLAYYMSYDLDLDGDGENDAMTLTFTTTPTPITLEGVACK